MIMMIMIMNYYCILFKVSNVTVCTDTLLFQLHHYKALEAIFWLDTNVKQYWRCIHSFIILCGAACLERSHKVNHSH